MAEDQIEYSRIILETDQDYREALAALHEQIEAASDLSDNIAIMANAIEEYEKVNDINII